MVKEKWQVPAKMSEYIYRTRVLETSPTIAATIGKQFASFVSLLSMFDPVDPRPFGTPVVSLSNYEGPIAETSLLK
mgnify:CR=1 FL=1